ncbi:MAG: hypothetical protein ACR2QR_04620 [Woeseiaceae bacterium]
MRATTIVTMAATIFLTASFASAQNNSEGQPVQADDDDLFIAVIENIDVTAEKELVETDHDPEIDAILDEAEVLEDDEKEE